MVDKGYRTGTLRKPAFASTPFETPEIRLIHIIPHHAGSSATPETSTRWTRWTPAVSSSVELLNQVSTTLKMLKIP